MNALAFPKGDVPRCEITGLTAEIRMVTPYIHLYFATRDDAMFAWEGIMHKLVPLLGPLRRQPGAVGSEEERRRRKRTTDIALRALIDLAKSEASRFLSERRYKLAIPGALQALKFSQEVYGDEHTELVACYLLLSEAYLGMKRPSEAEDFLTKANVCALKNEDTCGNEIKATLHRLFGRLYKMKGRHSSALRQMANCVYYTSLHTGPEHVDATRAYFDLGQLFFDMRKVEQGLAFYDKVVDIWYKYLASLQDEEKIDEIGNALQGEGARLRLAESAQEMLTVVHSTRKRYLGEDHIATGEALYTRGLLNLFWGTTSDTMMDIQAAVKVYALQLGEDHPSTRDLRQVLDVVREDAGMSKEEKSGT